ncbi:hypothetical protein F0562_005375 [Nyssa sinensis]|uniref:Uncharacterized protein n=1 Tax=Nyssa sinensis TaxID=561372 RepID=A0A5J5ANP3_9ASTE|nr:hypothetical protein F0562_005375 [Nyssa sinensis]
MRSFKRWRSSMLGGGHLRSVSRVRRLIERGKDIVHRIKVGIDDEMWICDFLTFASSEKGLLGQGMVTRGSGMLGEILTLKIGLFMLRHIGVRWLLVYRPKVLAGSSFKVSGGTFGSDGFSGAEDKPGTKWVDQKWRVLARIKVEDMHGSLFLFEFLPEDFYDGLRNHLADVAMDHAPHSGLMIICLALGWELGRWQ